MAASITSIPGASGTPVTILHEEGGDVSVLRQAGDVEWDRLLARGGTREEDSWVDSNPPDGLARVVVDKDGVVWTLASDELGADELLAVAEDLPSGDEGSFLDHLRGACDALLGG